DINRVGVLREGPSLQERRLLVEPKVQDAFLVHPSVDVGCERLRQACHRPSLPYCTDRLPVLDAPSESDEGISEVALKDLADRFSLRESEAQRGLDAALVLPRLHLGAGLDPMDR